MAVQSISQLFEIFFESIPNLPIFLSVNRYHIFDGKVFHFLDSHFLSNPFLIGFLQLYNKKLYKIYFGTQDFHGSNSTLHSISPELTTGLISTSEFLPITEDKILLLCNTSVRHLQMHLSDFNPQFYTCILHFIV